MTLKFTIETEQETDGRWLAEVMEIPGALAYGATNDESVARANSPSLTISMIHCRSM